MNPNVLVHNVRIDDVVTQRLRSGWFTIRDGRFVDVEPGGAPSASELDSYQRLDAGGLVAQPGLIDTHMHIESSLVTPRRFSEAVLPWGTTAILQDPHEIANVLGPQGIRWMINASRDLPLRVYSAISSCVPATSDSIETPNARIAPRDVAELATEDGVIALGEMMDYQGLLEESPHLLAMLAAAKEAGLSLEGHVPTLSGRRLSKYLAHGIRSDHTLMTPDKLTEELAKGAFVMLQEKSLTREVVDAVTRLPDRSRVLLITDDVMPNRLTGGHLSRIVQHAVSLGWEPFDALASATLRAAVYLGLRDLGAIAPGYHADVVLTRELNHYPAEYVFVRGQQVVREGRLDIATEPPQDMGLTRTSFELHDLPESFFHLTDNADAKGVLARAVRVQDSNTVTTLEERRVDLSGGVPIDSDLNLAVVIARHWLQGKAPSRGQVGLTAGLNLRDGAYASTFAHDSHNVFVVGRTPRSMQRAAKAVLSAGGGMAVVTNDHADPLLLELPIAGLLSDEPVAMLGERFEELEGALRALGVTAKNPVLLLTILPLTVSPHVKFSDKGLVDVDARQVMSPVIAS